MDTASEYAEIGALVLSFVQFAIKEYPTLKDVGEDIVMLVKKQLSGEALTDEEKQKIRDTQDAIDAALKTSVEARLALGNLEAG